ncbi:hypothetical protein CYMTET_3211 [Cymbomonas tetramitiformis]|uniref:Uncharacterized protein n=1 Tax=Cymbomonas tetramitiformis TaxID=36881 RepID=A0AAE0H3L3_9CHLO|nr:hypothetical protein CYMTET_3211 [Cymbomonas tetramitiformis]
MQPRESRSLGKPAEDLLRESVTPASPASPGAKLAEAYSLSTSLNTDMTPVSKKTVVHDEEPMSTTRLKSILPAVYTQPVRTRSATRRANSGLNRPTSPPRPTTSPYGSGRFSPHLGCSRSVVSPAAKTYHPHLANPQDLHLFGGRGKDDARLLVRIDRSVALKEEQIQKKKEEQVRLIEKEVAKESAYLRAKTNGPSDHKTDPRHKAWVRELSNRKAAAARKERAASARKEREAKMLPVSNSMPGPVQAELSEGEFVREPEGSLDGQEGAQEALDAIDLLQAPEEGEPVMWPEIATPPPASNAGAPLSPSESFSFRMPVEAGAGEDSEAVEVSPPILQLPVGVEDTPELGSPSAPPAEGTPGRMEWMQHYDQVKLSLSMRESSASELGPENSMRSQSAKVRRSFNGSTKSSAGVADWRYDTAIKSWFQKVDSRKKVDPVKKRVKDAMKQFQGVLLKINSRHGGRRGHHSTLDDDDEDSEFYRFEQELNNTQSSGPEIDQTSQSFGKGSGTKQQQSVRAPRSAIHQSIHKNRVKSATWSGGRPGPRLTASCPVNPDVPKKWQTPPSVKFTSKEEKPEPISIWISPGLFKWHGLNQ